jgi:fructoselysine 6-phosphate deglycase
MFSGKYLLDRFTSLTSDALTSYELVWRSPVRLDEHAIVFLASYSGGTEDTLAALRLAKTKGARTVAIVRRREPRSAMAMEADEVIDYESTALYILPLAAIYLFALEIAKITDPTCTNVEEVVDGLFALPPLVGSVFRGSEARARECAEVFADSTLLYVLGDGPLYGLAYKFALTVFMENIRMHGSLIETAEFRHGPVEMLDRERADMVLLVGTDESRDMTIRVLDLVRGRDNVRTLVFDMADYPDVHPLLAPFVLLIPLQWFTVYSALLRSITDLDKRAFMGRGLLAKGKATWP